MRFLNLTLTGDHVVGVGLGGARVKVNLTKITRVIVEWIKIAVELGAAYLQIQN
jgi:hypothetical protein